MSTILQVLPVEAVAPADVSLRYDFADSSANPKAPMLDDDDAAERLNELCVRWLLREASAHRRAMSRGLYLRTQCRAEHKRWPV